MEKYCDKNMCFYYYGEDHFVMNIYKYIKEELEVNNYVYIFSDENRYNLISSSFNSNERMMIGKIEIDKVILNGLRIVSNYTPSQFKVIQDIKTEILNQGFWGLNIIIDSTHLITSIGEAYFLEFISAMSLICNECKVNILTCYDFSDYINRGKIINEDVIKASYLNHNFRIFSNNILPMESFNTNSELA